MPLDTVGAYVAQARELLQDTASVQRYATGSLKDALGFSLMEARRLRPDLFVDGEMQTIDSATSDATVVTVDRQYRMALIYYMVGHMMLRDEEESMQQLARAYKAQFGSQLVSIAV
jgi:hypothetical protein